MWQASVPEVAPPGSVTTVSGKCHEGAVMPLFTSYEFDTYSVFWPVTLILVNITIVFSHREPKLYINYRLKYIYVIVTFKVLLPSLGANRSLVIMNMDFSWANLWESSSSASYFAMLL